MRGINDEEDVGVYNKSQTYSNDTLYKLLYLYKFILLKN